MEVEELAGGPRRRWSPLIDLSTDEEVVRYFHFPLSSQDPEKMKAPEWTIAHIAPQTGKIAVVTGANSGIGWHTALELARAGGEVILAARTEATRCSERQIFGWPVSAA